MPLIRDIITVKKERPEDEYAFHLAFSPTRDAGPNQKCTLTNESLLPEPQKKKARATNTISSRQVEQRVPKPRPLGKETRKIGHAGESDVFNMRGRWKNRS